MKFMEPKMVIAQIKTENIMVELDGSSQGEDGDA